MTNWKQQAEQLAKALEDCVSVLSDPIVGTIYHDEPSWYARLDDAVDKARHALTLFLNAKESE